MLEQSQIKRLALQYQTTEINVAREYAQHLFLSSFYQQPESGRILFKGGTALRVIFQSPRFSEDLDFSGFNTGITLIETLVLNVLEKIQQVGLEIRISERKKTSGGYLGIIDLGVSGYQARIFCEISLRKKNTIKGEPVLIANDFIPSYTVLMLPEPVLVEEKLTALLSRAKPRDYFDLYFLLRKGLVTVKQRKVLNKVKERLEKEKILLERELADFLPRTYQKLIRDFRKVLLREISRYC